MTVKHLSRKKFHSKLYSLHTVENSLCYREEQGIVNSGSPGKVV